MPPGLTVKDSIWLICDKSVTTQNLWFFRRHV